MMVARDLSGRPVIEKLATELTRRSRALAQAGIRPCLAAVSFGDDQATAMYFDRLERLCRRYETELLRVRLPLETGTEQVQQSLLQLATGGKAQGLIVQMPLPPQVDPAAVAAMIPEDMDVDGLSLEAAGKLYMGLPTVAPATAAAVMRLLSHYQVPVEGRHAVVVGRSLQVGRPAAMLLLHAHATVTICHSRTTDLGAVCRTADVLVVAIGRPGHVDGSMMRPGAVVIDVGTNVQDGHLVGDVDYDSARQVVAAITPVPGGVGPVTNHMLLRNLFQLASDRGR